MRVLIVEDETAAYDSLVGILHDIDPAIEVVSNTESVAQTIKWLKEHPEPDLILMDIHLSDGSAFLIFELMTIEIPIIFTTAYDQYAIDAFKVNSIDYILKPIKTSDLQHALQKFSKRSYIDQISYIANVANLAPPARYKSKMLIPVKDHLLPIDLQQVAFFYTSEKSTSIYLMDGTSHPVSKTLEQLYTTLNPATFYRANKQFIISRNAVNNITIWFDSRLYITLEIPVPERIYISKNKAADFKEWMVSG